MTLPVDSAIVRAMRLPSRCSSLLTVLALVLPAASFAAPGDEQVASSRHSGFASIGGLWCGAGLLHEFTLEVAQQLQNVQGRLVRKGRVREMTGHVEGSVVKLDPQRDHTRELRAEGDELRITGATGVLALAIGQSFTRAAGNSCKG